MDIDLSRAAEKSPNLGIPIIQAENSFLLQKGFETRSKT